MMKILIKHLLLAATISSMLFGGMACNKPSENTDDLTPPPTVLGTYNYGDEAYDITYAIFAENDKYYEFLLSPQVEGEKIHTYIQLAIKAGWCDGATNNFSERYHNDDYIVIYCDRNHYYSKYFPVKGTFSVSRNTTTNLIKIKIDGELTDGKPLKVNLSSVIEPSK